MENVLLVALGGAIGAAGRYAVVSQATRAFGPGQVWGTLMVNALGGLLIGILAAWTTARGGDGDRWRLLLGAGVLGGFTTFSAFSLETWTLLERGAVLTALGYAAASVILSVAAVAAGLRLVREFA